MDFLDRYGRQLERARRRRARRRATAGTLLVPAGAAVAIALFALPTEPEIETLAEPAPSPTVTWSPKVGRPENGLDANIDRTPVSRDARDVLAVLRRPQTERDRRLAAPRLRHTGGAVDGVQVDGVRALSKDYALVPVAKFKGAGEPMLCVIGGGGAGCGPVSNVREQGVGVTAGGRKGTHLFGIVPDGVARVRFTPEGGTPKDSIVRENFYDLRVPEHAPATPLRPPKGWLGPTDANGMIPGPGGPASGTLEWFDAAGTLIKRQR